MWLLKNGTNTLQGQMRSNAMTTSILEKYEFSESENSLCWYKQSHPVLCLENDKAKELWDNSMAFAQETVPTNLI